MRSRIILAALLVTSSPAARAAPPPTEEPRLVILTDISSLTTGEADPDDGQSLIRLMLPASPARVGMNVTCSGRVTAAPPAGVAVTPDASPSRQTSHPA